MKKRLLKALALLCVLTVILTVICSCSSEEPPTEESSIYQSTTAMINALIADDKEASRAVISSSVTDEEFNSAYIALKDAFAEVKSYELTLSSFKVNLNDGKTTKSVTYLLTSESTELIITSSELEGADGLIGFHVQHPATGTLGTFSKSNGLQKAMLLLNIPIIAFTVWMFVDCAISKAEKKPMWLILILLGLISISLNFTANGFSYNMGIGWFGSYMALLKQGDATVVRIMLPLPAIVWCIMKRRLLKDAEDRKAAENAPEKEQPKETPKSLHEEE
ncbi:MAG: hypothetical protein IKB23_04065 [Clostridia bacterium]|nr:hypothetical protein [Clostridia bacterium]